MDKPPPSSSPSPPEEAATTTIMAISLPPLQQTSSFHYSPYSLRLFIRHDRTPHTSVGLTVCCSESLATAALVEDIPGTRPGEAEVPKKAVYKVKKRRKPRPSFLDLIQDKWSVKIGSTREKFPWEEEQRRPEEKQPQQMRKRVVVNEDGREGGDEEEVAVREVKQEVVKDKGREERDEEEVGARKAPWVKHVLAPWVHGSEVARPRFDSPGNILTGARHTGEDEDGGGVAVIGQEVHLDVQVASDDGLDRIDNSFDSKLGLRDAEIGSEDERTDFGVVIKELLSDDDDDPGGNVGFGEVKPGGNVNAKGDVVDLPWRREGDSEGVSRQKKNKSNTELAERIIPEHELKRLRQVSLRMLERIKVRDAGVNQKLVDTIHGKWRVDEVVKLKFEGAPLHNMRRTQEILEVSDFPLPLCFELSP